MEIYNYIETPIKRISDEEKTKFSFWFTTEERDTACVSYTRYIRTLTAYHTISFKIDDTKRYYVNKLESGLEKEIKSMENNPDYNRDTIKYFKDNPIISELFEKVSNELLTLMKIKNNKILEEKKMTRKLKENVERISIIMKEASLTIVGEENKDINDAIELLKKCAESTIEKFPEHETIVVNLNPNEIDSVEEINLYINENTAKVRINSDPLTLEFTKKLGGN